MCDSNTLTIREVAGHICQRHADAAVTLLTGLLILVAAIVCHPTVMHKLVMWRAKQRKVCHIPTRVLIDKARAWTERNKAPSVHHIGNIIVWCGPLCFFAFFFSFALPRGQKEILRDVVTSAQALLALLMSFRVAVLYRCMVWVMRRNMHIQARNELFGAPEKGSPQ